MGMALRKNVILANFSLAHGQGEMYNYSLDWEMGNSAASI